MSHSTQAPAVQEPPRPRRAAAPGVAMASVIAVSTWATLYVPRDLGRATPIWAANALLLVWLLRSPRGGWAWRLAVGWAAVLAGALAAGDSLPLGLAMSMFNLLEVAICAFGLRRATPDGFDPARMADLAKGGVVALIASAISAGLASTFQALARGGDPVGYFPSWMLSDVLGLMILTPCLLILADWRGYSAGRPPTLRGAAILAAAVVLQAAVFADTRWPLLYMAPLAPLVAAMALEMVGAAVAVLATAVIAVGFTFAGFGPIAQEGSTWNERLIPLQLFVAITTGLTLQVAALHQQRRRAARELAAAVVEAEQAARVKAEFLANMSHEIRTPLTSILGFASLLAKKPLDREAARYADRVLGASRNLLALVNDVLDFSKLEAGRLEIRPQAGDPDHCAREVVDLFAEQAAAKGLSLAFDGGCGGVQVETDFDRVRQLLMNLVSNAVKFTPAGSVRVASDYDADGARLGFRVTDTGPGLDAAARGKLFRRFSQLEAGADRAHGGSGLGLAICKGLVEAMGGEIGVDSAPGAGATFWFEVPAPEAGAAQATAADALDPAAFVGLRVLLVDDNPANRELICSLLGPLGVAVTAADGGEAAIALADAHAFQLVLMDLRMPGMDGWTAASRIRGGGGPNRDTPILAFSADVAAKPSDEAGLFQDVVRKPIEMGELLVAIQTWAAPMAGARSSGPEMAAAARLTQRGGPR